MALTVTVEDGSGVVDANSYATLIRVRAYNEFRGVVLPDDDDAVVELMAVAMDYLESYEARWQGRRSNPATQELSWPRTGVMLFSTQLASNVVPKQIANAQCYLVGIATTVDLNAVQDTRAVTKEVIGPIETDYSTTAGAGGKPMIPLLDSMLAPLCNSGTGMLRAVRV